MVVHQHGYVVIVPAADILFGIGSKAVPRLDEVACLDTLAVLIEVVRAVSALFAFADQQIRRDHPLHVVVLVGRLDAIGAGRIRDVGKLRDVHQMIGNDRHIVSRGIMVLKIGRQT